MGKMRAKRTADVVEQGVAKTSVKFDGHWGGKSGNQYALMMVQGESVRKLMPIL